MDLSRVLPSLRCLCRGAWPGSPVSLELGAQLDHPAQVPEGAPEPHDARGGAHTGAPARAPAAAAPAAAHVRPAAAVPWPYSDDARLTAARRARKAGERRAASSAAGAASWGASVSSRRWMCGTAACGRCASDSGHRVVHPVPLWGTHKAGRLLEFVCRLSRGGLNASLSALPCNFSSAPCRPAAHRAPEQNHAEAAQAALLIRNVQSPRVQSFGPAPATPKLGLHMQDHVVC